MLLLVILFTVKFFFYQPLPSIYPYFDIIHLYAGCFVFPVYHIYFRLLTIDKRFSWKLHAQFLIIPFILGSMYAVGVLLTPTFEYRTSLFDNQAFPDSDQVHFLNTMRTIMTYYAQIQVINYLIRNFILIRKYNIRAEQFYSDLKDGKYNNANMLNYLVVINSIINIICYSIFRRSEEMIYIFPTTYAVMTYMIGYMGFKQKAINPTYDLEIESEPLNNQKQPLLKAQEHILRRLLEEFDNKKIYINSQLTILDVVDAVGTNRTYISNIINQQYNQNFCSFVNGYRIEELQRIFTQNPDLNDETLASYCGFNSVIALKRGITSKTGQSIHNWKKQILLVKNVG
jgi:AraC-like DNA-binding protein